jgi:sulfate transport system substrate-binding protein
MFRIRKPFFSFFLPRAATFPLAVVALVAGCGKPPDILNVSYDPTRGLYKEFNKAFATRWKETTGETIVIETSHGGSEGQARKVIEGLEASVVTLASACDIDVIHEKAGMLPADWQGRLPNHSCPYTSTIVFLVRKGNPKGIHDWDDLIEPEIEVITPHPKQSGGARWNYLAAWGYALGRELGGLKKLHDPKQAGAVSKAQKKAREFVAELFRHVKVLDSGARGATVTFAKQGQGDVLLAWENDAYWAIDEFGADQLEIVMPSVSILAEPPVALVDKVVDKQGKRKLAEAYLKFLYSPEGQAIVAKHHYRPLDPKATPATWIKPVKMFTVDDVFGGWRKAQKEHFDDGGVFDQIQKH